VLVRLGQAGLHTAPATVDPTVECHSAGVFHTPGFCARSRAVVTAPGSVLDAMTGWIKSRRLDEPAPCFHSHIDNLTSVSSTWVLWSRVCRDQINMSCPTERVFCFSTQKVAYCTHRRITREQRYL
jgi:hypothetical protein